MSNDIIMCYDRRNMEDGRREKGEDEDEEDEGRDLGVTFLKCNQPAAALQSNVNTGQRGALTACHSDS